jgi:hypothetical protein
VPLSGEIAVDVLGMKSHPNQDDDSPFNSPEEMLARLAFVLCLLALIAGIALVVIGVVTRGGWVALTGAASLGIGWLLRVWLGQRGVFDSASDDLDTMVGAELPAAQDHLQRLVALLNEWEKWEHKRGSAAFDPWALQAVRNDIQAIVQSDPALERLFRAHGRAA